LRPETLVVVGGQDQKCAALGAGIRPGVVTVSLGTATAISCLSKQPVLDPQQRIPAFPFVRPGLWDLEGVVGTSGAALKWVRDTFFPSVDYPELDDLARHSPPGARGVCFFPHLTGATSPLWQSEARGTFAGLSLAAGAGDVVRSVLEGVAFQIRSNLEVMATLASIDELVLFGGGAKSALWADIICQTSGKPVAVAHIVDVANWGACLLAGIGAGLYQADAVNGIPQQHSARLHPDPERARVYDDLYRAYRETEDRLLRE
jgi:xylulokinase